MAYPKIMKKRPSRGKYDNSLVELGSNYAPNIRILKNTKLGRNLLVPSHS
jgi:hypothetical protein